MTHTDLLYRALKEYRKLTSSHRETAQRREAIAKANAENDFLTVTRTSCVIDEDWVAAIEEGLPFIGKAIGEERQFILSNGETVEIEKVKHVSKESVTHLARHSNYITRVQEGEDIVPDRIYTVERLNDYTVYENRFLYMLLCNLRDFVSLRYNKILELTNTYTGALSFDKTVSINKDKLVYTVRLNEERKDDKFLLAHNPMKPMIDRIDLILRSVYYYLRTPLMLEVAKVDKLKPPITKTNVLRMDKNFKEVVKLYEFLLAYNKSGYEIVKDARELSLSEAVADEFAEAALMLSFLAYSHGLGIEKELQEEYEREEALRREQEKAALVERLRALKKRVEEGGGVEEYLMLLERRNADLEEDSANLKRCQKELERLNGEIEALNGEIETHRNEVAELNERHGRELAEIGLRIDELNRAAEEERARHTGELREAEEKFYRELTERDRASRAAILEKERETEETKTLLAREEEKRAFAEGRLNALRFHNGLMTPQDDFTSEEAFGEIERQYAAFQVFFRGQWRNARRRIRREMWKETLRNLFAKEPAGEKAAGEGELSTPAVEEAVENEEGAPAPASVEKTVEETVENGGSAVEPLAEETAESEEPFLEETAVEKTVESGETESAADRDEEDGEE